MTFSTLQTNLQKLGLYLGRIDGLPGPLSADALACAVAPHPAPLSGKALVAAIPPDWWLEHPNRVAMLYAMIVAETGFKLLVENLNYDAAALVRTWPSRFYSLPGGPIAKLNANTYAHQPALIAGAVYGGRMGNKQPGDGYFYRGRAWPQITGRDEYERFSPAADADLIATPDAVLDVMVSAKVSVAVLSEALAPADAGDVRTSRIDWNGGTIGLQVASDSFSKIQTLWGLK